MKRSLLLLLASFCLFSYTIQLKASDSTSVTLNQQQIANLDQLCRVWGFLKYHHPKVSKGKYDWDQKLMEAIPASMASKSSTENEKVLTDLINFAGQVKLQKAYAPAINKTITLAPDHNWMNSLSPSIKSSLENIERARHGSYYLTFHTFLGIPMFSNEKSYEDFKSIDQNHSLLSLFRTWNVIHYYYPYKKLLDKDWNLVLPELIPEFAQASTNQAYKLAVDHLAATINDNHVSVEWKKEIDMKDYQKVLEKLYRSPLNFTFVKDKLVVSSLDSKTNQDLSIQPGDEIIQVGQDTIASYLKEKVSTTPFSNEDCFYNRHTNDFTFSLDSVVKYRIRRNEQVLDLQIPYDKGYFGKEMHRETKWVGDGILYTHLNVWRKDSLDMLFAKMDSSKAVILDVRDYPDLKNNGRKFFNKIFEKETEIVRFSQVDKDHPGTFSYDTEPKRALLIADHVEFGSNNPDYYKGRLIILTDVSTQSAAESNASLLMLSPNSVIVGSHTAGANGNVSHLPLMKNLAISFSALGVYFPDGTCYQRKGLLPDVEVYPSIEGLRSKKDEVLEKAIEVAGWSEEKYRAHHWKGYRNLKL